MRYLVLVCALLSGCGTGLENLPPPQEVRSEARDLDAEVEQAQADIAAADGYLGLALERLDVQDPKRAASLRRLRARAAWALNVARHLTQGAEDGAASYMYVSNAVAVARDLARELRRAAEIARGVQ